MRLIAGRAALIAVSLGPMAFSAAGSTPAAAWVASWGMAPVPPTPAMGPLPATPTFANQTVRQIVHLSAGGKRVRLRFTNEYGTQPLRIGAASVAIADAEGGVQAGSVHEVLFAGRPVALIPAGAPLLSDPIEMPVAPRSNLSISLYLPEATGSCTCHPVGMQPTYVSEPGNFTSASFTAATTMDARPFVSGLVVENRASAKVVVAFGDSITDGVGSTPGANRRWPDIFAERLALRDAHRSWGVVNMGISGNRMLNDGAGQSALARFDRDALSVPGVAYVILFEGVNDLGISFGRFSGPMADLFKSMVPGDKATSAALIAGYRQLIDRAHAKGIKVIGGTIAPYEGAPYYSAEGETQRQEINDWIRQRGNFDGVIDFDSALRDPARPTQIRSGLHAGDHLHGSDAGYEAMADSIDLALFK